VQDAVWLKPSRDIACKTADEVSPYEYRTVLPLVWRGVRGESTDSLTTDVLRKGTQHCDLDGG